MDTFSPLPSFLGGTLIGLAASALLLFVGRIAGVSGIVGGLLRARTGDVSWRASFVAGLVGGGLALRALDPPALAIAIDRSPATLVLGGLLVGFGTHLGNGCTSGHGVCGLSRGSLRSLAATMTFMATGAATVAIVRHVLGGTP